MPEITAKQLLSSLKQLLSEQSPKETKAPRITQEEWLKWGRDLTPADVERFAKNRSGKTASFETFKALGCRVGPSGNPTLPGDFLGFPHKYTDGDKVLFDYIKLRGLDTKDLQTLHNHSQRGLYNIDTVNFAEDVYVVEGEPDVAVMEEAGFRAVSVNSGSQKKFDDDAINRLLVADRIFLVGDQAERQDDPGQKCMENLQSLLPPGQTFRVRFKEAHDVSELAKNLGDSFHKRIEELRDGSLEPWVIRNIPTVHELSPKPTEWVVDRMFPYGCLTMIAGSQGSMKSLLAVYAAQAIAAAPSKLHSARKFLGRKVMGGIPVLYLDRENSEAEAARRLRRMGVLINRDFYYWGEFCNEFPPDLDDSRLMEFAHREKGFIVIDSIQDWYPAKFNENDNTQVIELLGKLRRLARAGAGVLVLHHNAKYGQVARGGTAFVALTDMAIKCGKSESDPDIIELREERFRMCGGWELDFQAHWQHDEGQFPRYAIWNLEVTKDEELSEATRKAKEQERADAEAERVLLEQRNAKMDELLANSKMSQRELAEALTASGFTCKTANTAKAWAKLAGWEQVSGVWQKASGSVV